MNYLAPGITSEEYDPSRNLDVFQTRTEGWILAPAKRMSSEGDSGIAILILVSPVLQPMGAIRKPGNSEAEFCEGFRYAFPEVPGSDDLSSVAKEVCDLLRNGLYHEAFIKPGLFIRSQEHPIVTDADVIYIEPKLFLKAVEIAFRKLCAEIKNNASLRKNFDDYMIRRDSDTAKKRKTPIDPSVYASPTVLTTSAHSAVAALPSSGYLIGKGPFRTGPA